MDAALVTTTIHGKPRQDETIWLRDTTFARSALCPECGHRQPLPQAETAVTEWSLRRQGPYLPPSALIKITAADLLLLQLADDLRDPAYLAHFESDDGATSARGRRRKRSKRERTQAAKEQQPSTAAQRDWSVDDAWDLLVAALYVELSVDELRDIAGAVAGGEPIGYDDLTIDFYPPPGADDDAPENGSAMPDAADRAATVVVDLLDERVQCSRKAFLQRLETLLARYDEAQASYPFAEIDAALERYRQRITNDLRAETQGLARLGPGCLQALATYLVAAVLLVLVQLWLTRRADAAFTDGLGPLMVLVFIGASVAILIAAVARPRRT